MNKREMMDAGTDAWKAAGLPGRPVVSVRGAVDRDLPVGQLIADAKGNAIVLSGSLAKAEHAATAMREHLDRPIQVVHFFHPELHHTDFFGFTLVRSGAGRALSLPERAAVAALAKYCSNYRPGLRTDKPLALPRILQDESAIADGYIYDFIDESRAYMLADVCEELFGVDAEVVDDSNGWTVVLHDDDACTIGADKLAALQGICRLLQRYAITPEPMDQRTERPIAVDATAGEANGPESADRPGDRKFLSADGQIRTYRDNETGGFQAGNETPETQKSPIYRGNLAEREGFIFLCKSFIINVYNLQNILYHHFYHHFFPLELLIFWRINTNSNPVPNAVFNGTHPHIHLSN